jgi:hypothetical protein
VPVFGRHDVYVKFTGSGTAKLFMVQWMVFKDKSHPETTIMSIGELKSSQSPESFELGQNYPNPFNPVTQICYSVPQNSYISLKVYNLLGQEVASLFEGNRQEGKYLATFNGSNLSSGIYLYRMTAHQTEGRQTATNSLSGNTENFVDTKKTMLLK